MVMNVLCLLVSIVMYYNMRDEARKGDFDARFWQGFNAANILWNALTLVPKLL